MERGYTERDVIRTIDLTEPQGKLKEEDRNIYIFTPDGWKHLGTNRVAERRGIPLDSEDIEALKALYLENEDG